MLAHFLFFRVVQRARFAKNAVWNGHLADIVEESGARQDGQIRIRHGHGPRDRYAKRGDPLAMPFRFGILQVQGASESLERVVVRLLEFHMLCGELRSAFLDEMLQVALIVAVFDDQTAVLQRASNAQKELVLFEGLEDVVIGPATNGFESSGNVVDGGDHDHRHFGIVLPHPLEETDPVHLRHDHVAQNKVGRGLLDLVLGDAAILHGRAMIAL